MRQNKNEKTFNRFNDFKTKMNTKEYFSETKLGVFERN